MAGDEEGYRSRLRRSPGAPVQGVGSGYASNQALAGAQDPAEAARVAVMDPQQVRAEEERSAALASKLKALRVDILSAIQDRTWVPDLPRVDTSDWGPREWEAHLETFGAGDLESMKALADEAALKMQDDEDAAAVAAALSKEVGGVDPSDPLYDPLTDVARKRELESKLQPLDFEEMVWKGSCAQEVPLRAGFVVVYRTLTTQHGLWLEYYMSQQEESSYQHTRHLFSIIQVAATVDSINGKPIGGDLARYKKADQREEFLSALETRMEFIGNLPGVLSDDLIVQYVWFTGRVRKLVSGDLLGKVGNS